MCYSCLFLVSHTKNILQVEELISVFGRYLGVSELNLTWDTSCLYCLARNCCWGICLLNQTFGDDLWTCIAGAYIYTYSIMSIYICSLLWQQYTYIDIQKINLNRLLWDFFFNSFWMLLILFPNNFFFLLKGSRLMCSGGLGDTVFWNGGLCNTTCDVDLLKVPTEFNA